MTELWRLSATEAVELLRKREVSPIELIDVAADRIAETEPQLNALPILCLDRARERARAMMGEPRSARPPHHLHGLPICVKDNVDVAGVRCTRGSPLFAERVPSTSDIVVERLEANGALVVAKSNLPEFAAGGHSSNELFGVTRNPWNTDVTPGGSSGGTGAAVAAGQVWLGTGNDFGGSIRLPSSFCSLVGLRPTAGLVPRVQNQAFSPLNVEGPIARTVADCALMLECEAGAHPLDPLSAPVEPGALLRAARSPRPPDLAAFSLDLGVAPVIHADIAQVFDAAMQKLASAGCRLDDACPDLGDAERTFMTLRGAAFVANMGPLVETHRHQLKADVLGNAEFGLSLSVSDIARAEIAQGGIIRRMAKFFERYDVLVAPTAICPPLPVEQRHLSELGGAKFGDYLGWAILTTAISATACPVLNLPIGFTQAGLPVGMQIVGPRRSEAKLLAIGAYLESVLQVSPKTPIQPRGPRSRAA